MLPKSRNINCVYRILWYLVNGRGTTVSPTQFQTKMLWKMQQLLTSVFPHFVCPHQLGWWFFGGEGFCWCFVPLRFANKETKTKLCYSCIIFTIEMVTCFLLCHSNAQILGKRAYLSTMPTCGQLWTGMRQNGGPSSHERKVFFYWNWKADDLDKNLSNFGFGFMLFFLKPGCDTSGWWQWHVI